MHLVMFDIDGTLTATGDVDGRCYARAVREALKIDRFDMTWGNYKFVTDSGIASEIIENMFGRNATATELDLIEKRFMELLMVEARKDPHLFAAIPGAGKMLETLKQKPNTAIAMATGAWKRSAVLKLETAGLQVDGIVLTSSSDAVSKEEILPLAEKLALDAHGQKTFDSVVYIGDGLWDLKAAKHMGYRFIGLNKGKRAEELMDAGAEFVIPDFLDLDSILRGLDNCFE